MLRAIAGGVATGVALSDWFIIVTSFGSLLIVTGKRSGEAGRLVAQDRSRNRSTNPQPLHARVPSNGPDAVSWRDGDRLLPVGVRTGLCRV